MGYLRALAVITAFSILFPVTPAIAGEAPAMFLICSLKGDEADTACDQSAKRFLAAGYTVNRIDGPNFRGRAQFEAALKRASQPFVHIVGHGAIHKNGNHALFLGEDGGSRYFPTSELVNGVTRLNPGAQVFVESCRSGQLLCQSTPPKGCVGVSCRADEYSPVSVLERKEGKVSSAEGDALRPILDLLTAPANDFKYWSGGSCEISGERLKEYLSFKLAPGRVELDCRVEAFDGQKARPGRAVLEDEALCQKKIDALRATSGLQVQTNVKYNFDVTCTRFQPGKVLRTFGDFASVGSLDEILNKPARLEAPSGIQWKDHESFSPYELTGLGCQAQPGFRAKTFSAEVVFHAKRDGKPAAIYDDNPERMRALPGDLVEFLQEWDKVKPFAPAKKRDRQIVVLPGPDETDTSTKRRPSAMRSSPTFFGVATPDFGAIRFRHARCTEGEYRRPARTGAGLSFRTHGDAAAP